MPVTSASFKCMHASLAIRFGFWSLPTTAAMSRKP